MSYDKPQVDPNRNPLMNQLSIKKWSPDAGLFAEMDAALTKGGRPAPTEVKDA